MKLLEEKNVKMCKLCGKLFDSENLKTEYCSTQFRNQSNVYRKRVKNKELGDNYNEKI